MPVLRSTRNALGVLAGGGEADLADHSSGEVLIDVERGSRVWVQTPNTAVAAMPAISTRQGTKRSLELQNIDVGLCAVGTALLRARTHGKSRACLSDTRCTIPILCTVCTYPTVDVHVLTSLSLDLLRPPTHPSPFRADVHGCRPQHGKARARARRRHAAVAADRTEGREQRWRAAARAPPLLDPRSFVDGYACSANPGKVGNGISAVCVGSVEDV